MKRMLVAMWVSLALGVAAVVAGTFIGYGPLMVVGGILLGFSLGVKLHRQAIRDVQRELGRGYGD